ncbi:hypothetical protein M413DRAFT_23547 [Hebeloma cylindrosporum]|uniref:Uncharacterized protein n=1 Tax=Hebeloma cylindrosporum TaxID=76867 RepID=A0A0C3CTA5_HEBCY|nr:hypothetical protein M413DRAFT_23547 [Hebeloma cylindrosporum h7]
MPPYFEPPTPNNAPQSIFDAIAGGEESPAPIDFSNVNLDGFFQRSHPRPPYANGAPAAYAVSRNSSISMNGQNPSQVASPLSRNSSFSGISDVLNSPATYFHRLAPIPVHGQVTSSISRSPYVSGLSQVSNSPVIDSPNPIIVYDAPPPRSLSRSSSLSGTLKFSARPKLAPLRRRSTMARPYVASSTMPNNLEVATLNGSLTGYRAITPHPTLRALSRTPSISGTSSTLPHVIGPTSGDVFFNSTPLDFAAPNGLNGQSSLPAQSNPQEYTVNSPRVNSPAPTAQQPARPAPSTLSRSSSLPGNSQVFKTPSISGQTPTRQRPSTLSRSHTVSGSIQVPESIPSNSPAPAFLRGQIPQHLSPTPVFVAPSPLQYSENNKPQASLKRARTASSF